MFSSLAYEEMMQSKPVGHFPVTYLGAQFFFILMPFSSCHTSYLFDMSAVTCLRHPKLRHWWSYGKVLPHVAHQLVAIECNMQ